MRQLRFKLDNNGFVVACGYTDLPFLANETTPFSSIDNAFNWQKDLTIGEWKLRDELLYKYFLIPVELVPNIAHYADFVKETFPDLIFDVVLDRQIIPVEGVNVEVPTTQVKMIPCNCTQWTEEGLQLLDAVTENWNTSNPNKLITFPVKFESYAEFETFRNEHLQV